MINFIAGLFFGAMIGRPLWDIAAKIFANAYKEYKKS